MKWPLLGFGLRVKYYFARPDPNSPNPLLGSSVDEVEATNLQSAIGHAIALIHRHHFDISNYLNYK